MCSLELAIKINEPIELSMNLLSELSQGAYSVEELSKTETEILTALDWYVNPPTSNVFVDHLMELLPPSVPIPVKQRILSLSHLQTESATRDYYFVLHRPSTIGLASLLNALSTLDLLCFSPRARCTFYRNINVFAGIDPESTLIHAVQAKLQHKFRYIFESDGDKNLHHLQRTFSKKYHSGSKQDSSPVCVRSVTRNAY